MTIISEVPEGKYLVKMTASELAIILNAKAYVDSDFRKAMESAIKNEMQLKPSTLYEHFSKVKAMLGRKEIEESIKTFQKALDTLSPLEDQIKEIASCYPDEMK